MARRMKEDGELEQQADPGPDGSNELEGHRQAMARLREGFKALAAEHNRHGHDATKRFDLGAYVGALETLIGETIGSVPAYPLEGVAAEGA